MTPDQFISSIVAAAQASMRLYNVPASFTIAQGADESGWGSSALCTQGCNIFGVKADPSWRGDTVDMLTREYLNGQWVQVVAHWRKYPDWLSCINDHAQFFIQNPRYAPAFTTVGGEAFARAIAAAGYATDPAYADKLISIMRAHNLAQYDVTDPDGGTAPVNF